MSETLEQKYKVIRDCCRSGYCHECHAAGRAGTRARGRVVQGDNLSRDMAEKYKDGWREFHPVIEPQE